MKTHYSYELRDGRTVMLRLTVSERKLSDLLLAKLKGRGAKLGSKTTLADGAVVGEIVDVRDPQPLAPKS